LRPDRRTSQAPPCRPVEGAIAVRAGHASAGIGPQRRSRHRRQRNRKMDATQTRSPAPMLRGRGGWRCQPVMARVGHMCLVETPTAPENDCAMRPSPGPEPWPAFAQRTPPMCSSLVRPRLNPKIEIIAAASCPIHRKQADPGRANQGGLADHIGAERIA